MQGSYEKYVLLYLSYDTRYMYKNTTKILIRMCKNVIVAKQNVNSELQNESCLI